MTLNKESVFLDLDLVFKLLSSSYENCRLFGYRFQISDIQFVNCLPLRIHKMTYQDKLAGIRSQMEKDQVEAYIIPSADPHISEYVPDRYKCIAFTSGFTGSAGTLVITHDFAGLWTDARYFVQAEEQLQDSGFQLVKLQAQATPEYIAWLTGRLNEGATVAFDANLISIQLAELLETELAFAGIKISSDKDYLSPVWENRPGLPTETAYLLPDTITGKTVSSKLEEVKAALSKYRTHYHLISSLDDIAWLFNIRGSDVKCNPVVLAFALLKPEGTSLYIDETKLSAQEKSQLTECGVELEPYGGVSNALASIPAGSSILVDPKRNCFALYQQIPQSVKVVFDTNPSTNFKALKNATEIANTRRTMIRDGVALTRFFKWLDENIGRSRLTEISVAERLYQFRAEQEDFVGESFDTIAGYKEHGALPHYKATPQSDVELKADGLFLLDSGGQYKSGTTDITRVVSLGNITDEEKIDYTLVLKGMIEGSTARFPKGSKGYQIDAITRKPLWDHARNYGHGTGHGVGYFLNVHEGPQIFNPSNWPVEIEPGMITSVEPGIYRPFKYGIRIENLVLTVVDEISEFGEFYTFETLTLFVIDTAPVKKDLLQPHHIEWLNNYNEEVVAKLGPLLDEEELRWLKEKAKAI
ncbi:Xaa-Pro aminopeptidase [Arcticibacter tournemirensis]|nr:Xaa-Pro aminopeptidase [Arcticibacter tournemirensis]